MTNSSTNGLPAAEPTVESVAAYMRVSSDVQKTQGTIENQRAALDRYLAVDGVTLYGTYEDEAVSGYYVPFEQRPNGKRLLTDVRAGHVRLVVVTKLDRLGRNAFEILRAVKQIEQAGGRLISLKENVDTSTSAGRFFLTVLAGVAELERDAIVERTNEGTVRRLERTTWMGGHPPIGYAVSGKRKDAHLVIDETTDPASGYSEADTYRLVWHLCVESGWSCEDIADRLSELDIPTRARRRGMTVYTRGEQVRPVSHAWSPMVIYQMLTNPIYKGEHTYRTKTGELVIRPAPALVTPEQWDRAQAALFDHRRSTAKSRNGEYLLRDMLRCGHCGARFTTSWTRRHAPGNNGELGELWRYYECARRRHGRAYARRRAGKAASGELGAEIAAAEPETCIAPTLSAVWVEQEVWQKAEHYIRHPEDALTLLAARMGGAVQTADSERGEVTHLQVELDAFQAERDRIFTYFRKGTMTERDLDRQLAAIAQDEALVRERRAAALARLAEASIETDRMTAARTMLQELHAEMDSGPLTLDRKRGFLERIIRQIVVGTHEAGLSVRKRMKYRAEVVVYWAFDDPDVPAAGVGGTGQQKSDVQSSVCRR